MNLEYIMVKVKHALNHHWCETSLLATSSFLKHVMSRNFIVKKKSVHETSCSHMWVTSGLLCGSLDQYTTLFPMARSLGYICMIWLYRSIWDNVISLSYITIETYIIIVNREVMYIAIILCCYILIVNNFCWQFNFIAKILFDTHFAQVSRSYYRNGKVPSTS